MIGLEKFSLEELAKLAELSALTCDQILLNKIASELAYRKWDGQSIEAFEILLKSYGYDYEEGQLQIEDKKLKKGNKL